MAYIVCGKEIRSRLVVFLTAAWQTRLMMTVRNRNGALLREIRRLEKRLAAAGNAATSLCRCEERFRLMAEASQEGLWDWDINNGRIWWSNRMHEILGLPPEAFKGRFSEFKALCHPDDRNRFEEAVSAHSQTGAPYNIELRMRRGDGSYGVFIARVKAVPGPGGLPVRMAGSLREVSSLRALEAELLEISDRERKRIGTDLHDGLSQRLAGIRLLADTLRIDAAENGEASAQADRIAEQADEALGDVRMVIRGLFPVCLESKGLCGALRQLAAGSERLFSVTCRVEDDPARSIRPLAATAIHLYRIAQEAISNAVKHGKATRVRVLLGERSGVFQMSIIDNGRWRARIAPDSEGLGLRIMRSRAEAIGGRLTILPGGKKGTEVRCVYDPGSAEARAAATGAFSPPGPS